MLRICIICVIYALFLQGCLNVNLKSVLPNQIYYSLDSIILSEPCKNIESTYNVSVNVLSPYDGKDILVYNPDMQIKILDTYKWIDLPKNMIRNALAKVGANNCVNIELNSSVVQKIGTIRLNINDMHVKKEDSVYSAYIYATFELLNYDLSKTKSDAIIITAQDSNPIKALQDSIQKALNAIISSVKNVKKM